MEKKVFSKPTQLEALFVYKMTEVTMWNYLSIVISSCLLFRKIFILHGLYNQLEFFWAVWRQWLSSSIQDANETLNLQELKSIPKNEEHP